MTREILIKKTVENISKLPDQNLQRFMILLNFFLTELKID